MSWRTWDETTVKGRKGYACHMCGWLIRKGHPHTTWKCADDRQPPLTCRAHLICRRLDIGIDDEDELHAEWGREDWAMRCEGRVPWDRWDDTSPPELNDWLRNLPPIEWAT